MKVITSLRQLRQHDWVCSSNVTIGWARTVSHIEHRISEVSDTQIRESVSNSHEENAKKINTLHLIISVLITWRLTSLTIIWIDYFENVILGYFKRSMYLFKVNHRNSCKSCKICSKLIIKTAERRHWGRSGVFIVNFEHINNFV